MFKTTSIFYSEIYQYKSPENSHFLCFASNKTQEHNYRLNYKGEPRHSHREKQFSTNKQAFERQESETNMKDTNNKGKKNEPLSSTSDKSKQFQSKLKQ